MPPRISTKVPTQIRALRKELGFSQQTVQAQIPPEEPPAMPRISGVFANVVALLDFGKNFFGEETGVGFAEGVVLHATVAWFFAGLLSGETTGVDEDTEGDWHVAFGDEVVEDGGGAEWTFGSGVTETVLEDHEGGGF